MKLRVPRVVRQFADVLEEAGYECHLVGGAVRDLLMGRDLTDFDMATNAHPNQVSRLYRRVIPTGIKHGTVTVLYKGQRFEVTTYRTETGYSDARHPDHVDLTATIEEDLSRRDFTINGMAYRLSRDQLLDPYGGRGDIKKRLVRAIGDPAERFDEDGLRPLRACRFAAQLDFSIVKATADAVPGALARVASVSNERVREELTRIVQAEAVVHGFLLMRETGLLALLLPELNRCAGVEQRALHCYDVLMHSLYACAAADRSDLELRLAALLHDTGKAVTRTIGEDGEPRFHRHEQASAEIAEAVLQRLRYPNALIEAVVHLVRHHMFNYTPEWKDAAVRRFIARVGRQHIRDLVALRRADQIAHCNRWAPNPGLDQMMRRVEEMLAQEQAVTIADLQVNGRDLMETLNIPPGPEVGVLLSSLLETVLDDPSQNTRDRLLQIAERLYRSRVRP